jgi:hypothetical protein
MTFKKKPQKIKTWYKMLISLFTTYCFLCAEFFLDPSGKSVIVIPIYWKISFTRKIIEKQCLFFIFLYLLKIFLLIIFYWEAEKFQFFFNSIFIFVPIVGFMRQVEHIKWKICSKINGRKFNKKIILNNWKF